MKNIVRALSALGTAVVFAACSNAGSSGTITPSSVTSGSQALPAQSKPGSGTVEFAYVTDHAQNNRAENRIFLYEIDAKTGNYLDPLLH